MSSGWYDGGAVPQTRGTLPAGQGRRVRWMMVFYIIVCFLPIFLALLSLLFGVARFSMERPPPGAALAVSVGVVGVLVTFMLITALLWARSQIVGDVIGGGVRTVGLVLMTLGTAIIMTGIITGFAAVPRGALDVVAGSAGLGTTGIISLIGGAVLVHVANRARGGVTPDGGRQNPVAR